MAWRDSRSSRSRLFLFSLSIVFGVAALVAIRSFGHNLEAAIAEQSKSLLGADLVISSRQPFTPEIERLLEGLGQAQSREIGFSSMVYFPKTDGSRLVQVRGLKGGFPFYGEMETAPADARADFQNGDFALLEEGLMVQFEVETGDEVRIGNQVFRVAGALRRVPGEMAAVGVLAPRVYIPYDTLPATGLLREGSLARHKVFIQFPPSTDVPAVVESLRPELREHRLRIETVERRQEELGRTMENVRAFFQLVGFVALLLGVIGVASAIHVYVKRKIGSAAVLRCLGADARRIFLIYLTQGAALGAIGAGAGALLGVALQGLLPRVARDFLPFDVPVFISWAAVAEGFSVGFLFSLMFTLLPLLPLRRVSPLRAIRRGDAFARETRRDPWRWALCGLIAATVTLFAVVQTGSPRLGIGAAGAMGAAFATLAGTAALIAWLARRFTPPSLPYVWRQGLANLHRPENRTILLMLALGLGTFLVLGLYLARDLLVRQVLIAGEGDRPTMAMFDIQDDQREEIADLITARGLPVLQDVPIVTMRLASVRGQSVESLLREPGNEIPNWVLRREYRSTYRDHTVPTERVVAGTWVGSVEDNAGEPYPVSVEQGIAQDLGLAVGDSLVFDVQGIPIETVVGSIRSVEWQRVQPNFFVVFPRGVLEPAPKFHVMITRTETTEESAQLQREVVRRFANVSVIDLSLILQTVDSIMGRVSFVIRFMAMFTVVTGLAVLVAAVATSRYQRVREAVLLRTLGASRQQIRRIMVCEYLCLGFFAGLTGALLATAASWAMAAYVFHVPFHLPLLPPVAALALTMVVTLATGLASSRGILNHPPLAVLQAGD